MYCTQLIHLVEKMPYTVLSCMVFKSVEKKVIFQSESRIPSDAHGSRQPQWCLNGDLDVSGHAAGLGSLLRDPQNISIKTRNLPLLNTTLPASCVSLIHFFFFARPLS